MKHIGQVIRVSLLVLSSLLALGTSKVLSGKTLVGQVVAAPSGLTTVSGPSLRLWENVNNQGCFSTQLLDVEVTVRLRNTSPAPLLATVQNAGLLIDGKPFPVTALRILALDEQGRPAISRPDLAPATTSDLALVGQALLPKRVLSEVDRIEAFVDFPVGRLRLEVPGLRAVPVREGR